MKGFLTKRLMEFLSEILNKYPRSFLRKRRTKFGKKIHGRFCEECHREMYKTVHARVSIFLLEIARNKISSWISKAIAEIKNSERILGWFCGITRDRIVGRISGIIFGR